MNIKRDWPITLDPEPFLKLHGDTYSRMLRRPATRGAWDEVFAEAAALVRPAAAWDAFPIRELRHEKVILENGFRIGNGPVTAVVGGASHLIVAVCTIGQPISDRIKEYQQAGDPLRSLLLDNLGTFAVGMLSQRLCHSLEMDATGRGLHVSTSLSPGESEWLLNDQAVIFSLLDAAAIGVSLTESMLMKPIKSVSLIMGLGPQPMGAEGASHCDYCRLADRCIYRNKREEALPA